MSRRLISTGSPFEKTAGYSRAVIDGEFAFVAGTTGYDYTTMTMPADVTSQSRNCFKTIEAALKEGGFEMADIVRVTYYLTDVSLAQRDQQIIKGKLGDYAAAYLRGGARVLAATVRAEQQAAPERLFVRVVDRGVESIVLSDPEGWDQSKLELVSARLADGTLVQVGKSTEAREALLAQFRAALGLVTLLIVVVKFYRGTS